MNWALKGLSGPLKDSIHSIRTGLTLGRQGDVVIQDARVSSIHARVSQTDQVWWLEDNNSKNGIRVNGERIARVELTPGTKFFIGTQSFEVVDLAMKPDDATVVIPLRSAKTPAPPPLKPTITSVAAEVLVPMPSAPEPPAPPQPARKRYWYEILASFVGRPELFVDQPRNVAPLDPAVVLDFVRGIQANSHWILGYGPRRIGANTLDLPIWEPGAPAICFELLPSAQGIIFKTAHPDIVFLNGNSVDNQVLHVGDTIRILETTIEVDFIT